VSYPRELFARRLKSLLRADPKDALRLDNNVKPKSLESRDFDWFRAHERCFPPQIYNDDMPICNAYKNDEHVKAIPNILNT
jgi:hypothetical protein